MQQSYAAISPQLRGAAPSEEAVQMAEILGIRSQFDRLHALSATADSDGQEALALRGQILQKVLTGFLEVRRASDRNFRELSYTFNIMRREQRKQDLINQMFTFANFAQLGTLYTMEPFFRLHTHFKTSAICTTTGGGLGLTLPTLNILQQKTAHIKHIEPPPAMRNVIEGGPVDASGLPLYVDRFLDTPVPGSAQSRRSEMFALWKKRYGVDPSNKATLCSLHNEGKPQKMGMLRTRILLLFSLQTYVLQMDSSLLALLKQIEPAGVYSPGGAHDSSQLTALGFNARAIEAARLLDIQSPVARLCTINKGGAGLDNPERLRLESTVLERLIAGSLEVRAATDEIDAELNYASDVVLAELLAKRGKALQLNYEINFIQAGTFGSTAGLLYLNGYTKAGNDMFVISGGIGTCLSTMALRLMRGGSRKIDTEPNMLANIFDFRQRGEYTFSPLITAYLNSPDPTSKNGKSRREELFQYWKEHKITSVDLGKEKTLNNLAAMPGAKPDTIKIVTNRIAMLHAVESKLEAFDGILLELLNATQPSAALSADQSVTTVTLTPEANETANLIGAQSLVSKVRANPNNPTYTLALVRTVFTTALDVRATEDTLDGEISYEYDVLNRMVRARDKVVAMTNNANFYQLNILALIIDGLLGQSHKPNNVRASNILNIVSGLSVGTLAGLTLIEQHGGSRPLPANPNMLGQTIGVSPPEDYRFSPVIWQYINNVPPGSSDGQTRVERMKLAWKQAKTININMDKQSNREKVAAFGPAHSQHSESIKLIKNRLNMLYDVEGLVGQFNRGLDELMLAAG